MKTIAKAYPHNEATKGYLPIQPDRTIFVSASTRMRNRLSGAAPVILWAVVFAGLITLFWSSR